MSNLFRIISASDYDRYITTPAFDTSIKYESYTNYELSKLNSLFQKFYKHKDPYILSGNIKVGVFVQITKMCDDWFYLYSAIKVQKYVYTYYKCDQLDGLISCLNSL